VPVAGLDDLAAAVATATAEVGEPPDPRPFAGHLTLARLRRRGSCRLAGHKVQARMTVPEVTLVASTLGADGPAYRTVATFPLDGQR
jgi:RNA 2',3'-cyclic 3'-phosphodiesterase